MANLHQPAEMAIADELRNVTNSEHNDEADDLFGSGSDDADGDSRPTEAATSNAAIRRRGRLAVESDDENDDKDGDKLALPNSHEVVDDNSDDETGLFGSDSEAESTGSVTNDVGGKASRATHSDEEMDEPIARTPPPALRIHLTQPSAPVSGEDSSDYYLARLPKHYHLETKPFDPSSYEAEILEVLDKEGKTQNTDEQSNTEGKGRNANSGDEEATQQATQLRLRVQGALRWRHAPQSATETNTEVESNARIIRWSDDSLSLYVNGELFDIDRQPMHDEHHYALTHHPEEGVLKVDRRLTSHLVFRTTSATGLAAQLEAASTEQKKQTKAVLVFEDPEKLQRQQAEVEKQRLRHERKIASYTQSRVARQSARQYADSGLTVDDLEAEELDDRMETDDYSYRARGGRNRRQGNELSDFIVDDEDEEVDEEADEEMVSHKSRRQQRYRQYSDDDDDDDEDTNNNNNDDDDDKS
ncbi:Leo1-like protein-domain-containing protein [Syncephalis fuscata]|nr:Leo1-like protein-domain-containing protein [Syncephalis fuscata]